MRVTRGQQLQVQGLSKRFGDTLALQDMTFAVQPGELFGFVGSNGAGKTTAMRIVLGVLSADSGHVDLGGQPIDRVVRRRIGYMPEERGLYPKMKVGPQLSSATSSGCSWRRHWSTIPMCWCSTSRSPGSTR